jgi:hypothetical protein
MRVAILTGGTATQNLQFDTVHKPRAFDNFIDLELEEQPNRHHPLEQPRKWWSARRGGSK